MLSLRLLVFTPLRVLVEVTQNLLQPIIGEVQFAQTFDAGQLLECLQVGRYPFLDMVSIAHTDVRFL